MKGVSDTVRLMNRMVEQSHRGQAIVLEFLEPIRESQLAQFNRVHLTRDMMTSGEDQAYRPEMLQPHVIKQSDICPLCQRQMRQDYVYGMRCLNGNCPMFGKLRVGGPQQGIIRVGYFPEYVAGVEPDGDRSFKLLNAVVIFLDRRYADHVLDAIRRTCGVLCEELGWKLK